MMGGCLLSYSGRRRDWISWATAGLAPKLARGIEVVIVGGLVVSLRVVENLRMLRGALWGVVWKTLRVDGLVIMNPSVWEVEERHLFIQAMLSDSACV
jgi:hypothetical protein